MLFLLPIVRNAIFNTEISLMMGFKSNRLLLALKLLFAKLTMHGDSLPDTALTLAAIDHLDNQQDDSGEFFDELRMLLPSLLVPFQFNVVRNDYRTNDSKVSSIGEEFMVHLPFNHSFEDMITRKEEEENAKEQLSSSEHRITSKPLIFAIQLRRQNYISDEKISTPKELPRYYHFERKYSLFAACFTSEKKRILPVNRPSFCTTLPIRMFFNYFDQMFGVFFVAS